MQSARSLHPGFLSSLSSGVKGGSPYITEFPHALVRSASLHLSIPRLTSYFLPCNLLLACLFALPLPRLSSCRRLAFVATPRAFILDSLPSPSSLSTHICPGSVLNTASLPPSEPPTSITTRATGDSRPSTVRSSSKACIAIMG